MAEPGQGPPKEVVTTASSKDLLDNWREYVVLRQKAHYLSADYFSRMSSSLGIPVIVLTALVGTSVFARLQKQPEFWLQVAVGVASVLAAILASLQSFLGYSVRAEKHRVAEVKYGAAGRRLEELRTSNKADSGAIAELLNKLDEESPHIPAWISRAAAAKLEAAPLVTLGAQKEEHLKMRYLAAYIALLVAGAAGGSKLMALGPVTAAVTVVSYAFTVLILDLVNQLFGQEEAKSFIVPGFMSLFLATGFMYLFVYLPSDPKNPKDFDAAYALVLVPPIRMFFAGLTAYLVGQSLNIFIFDKIRKKTTFEQRGHRNVGSTLLSQFVDTLIFVPGAFWRLHGIPITGLPKIFIGQFAFKAVIAIFLFPVFMFLTRVWKGGGSDPAIK